MLCSPTVGIKSIPQVYQFFTLWLYTKGETEFLTLAAALGVAA